MGFVVVVVSPPRPIASSEERAERVRHPFPLSGWGPSDLSSAPKPHRNIVPGFALLPTPDLSPWKEGCSPSC